MGWPRVSVCDHVYTQDGVPPINCSESPTGRLICTDNPDLIPLDYCETHGPKQAWLLLLAGHEVRFERLMPDSPAISRLEWDRKRVSRVIDVIVARAGGPSQMTRLTALAQVRRQMGQPASAHEPEALERLRRMPPLDDALKSTQRIPGLQQAWP